MLMIIVIKRISLIYCKKNKRAEGISLTCKDIAISGIVISRFGCIYLED
jgi:hypothetical protein